MARAKQDTGGASGDAAGGPSFEQSIEQVEQIIERIERGEQGLERSITDYERGAALLKQCREVLARSEQRIQEIEADLSKAGQAVESATRAPAGQADAGRASGKNSSIPPPPPTDEEDDTPF